MFWVRIADGVVIGVYKIDPGGGAIETAVRPAPGWTYDGADFSPPSVSDADALAAERARMECSILQMRLTLLSAGILDAVNAAVELDAAAQVAWEYGTIVERNSAFIGALAAGFTNPLTGVLITEEEIDDLFRAAMTVVT